MEKDDELKGSGNSYDFGARMYDSRLGRWLTLDPIPKGNESPFAVFSNNPIWFVDPDGNDTLVIHRSKRISNMNDGMSAIYIVTFSVIRKGVETRVGKVMYMMGHQDWVKLKDGEDYVLRFESMNNVVLKDSPNTIKVEYPGKRIFIHPANKAGQLTGCLTLTEEKPVKNDWGRWLNTYFASKTADALISVREIYNEADGGEGGGQLTGEKFLLRTDSQAKSDVPELKLRKLPNLLEMTENKSEIPTSGTPNN
jgi:RHS repeat-associated protein